MSQISEDQQKRLEYTARQKALYDYNTLVEENYQRGYAEGEEMGIHIGIEKGIEKRNQELVQQMRARGVDEKFIRQFFGNV